MKYLLSAMAAILLLATAGCATDRYPLSGEKCSPDDPVRSMNEPPCADITAK